MVLLVATAACGGKPATSVARPLPREPCPRVGQVSPKSEKASLRAMFRAHGRDLIVAEGFVFEIPCSEFRVAGASEGSEIRGQSEISQIAGKSEDSRLAGSGEQSRVAAAGESSKISAAGEGSNVRSGGESSEVRRVDEASSIRHAGEDSHVGSEGEDGRLAAASTKLFCERLGKGHYRIVAETARTSSLKVFDGAMLVDVGADGSVR